MRILLWIDQFWPNVGGLEVITAEMAVELRRRGLEVMIITNQTAAHFPAEDVFAGIPVLRYPFRRALESADARQFLQISKRVRETIASFRPDLLHVHFGSSAAFVLGVLDHMSAPVITTLHGPVVLNADTFHREAVITRLVDRSGVVTCVSEAVRQAVVRYMPEVADKTVCIHNGLPEPSVRWRGGNQTEPHFGCFGRLAPEKGFDVAVQAFHKVAAQEPSARLTLFGEGPERARLERLAGASAGGAVTLAGWAAPDDVPSVMAGMDAVVMPSRIFEPFGLVALQALQVGVPLLATSVGGIPEIVPASHRPYLLVDGDVDGTAKAMLHLIRSPAQARKRAAEAAEWVRRTFSFDAMMDSYLSRYRNLI